MQTETERAEAADAEKENDTLGTRSEVEVLGACKRRIRATVPGDKVKQELDKNYKELAGTIQLPGFRRGRIPRKLLEARYGKDIEGDVKEALLSVSLTEVVDEKELKIIGAPKFDEVQWKADSDLTYVVDVEVRPEFEVPSYEGISVTRESVPVTDANVEERIQALQRNHAKLVLMGAEEADADSVFLGKYDLTRNGEKVKTGVLARFTPSSKVLHSFFVEDLPERVKAWDRQGPLTLTVKVGTDFPDEVLRGSECELEFTLMETRRVELPALDDELAVKLGKKSVEELRQSIRSVLEDVSRREEEKRVESKIVEKLLESTAMELPERFVETVQGRRKLEKEYALLERGLSKEEAQEILVKEAASSSEETQREAIRREMKEFFLLEGIADKEKIYATEEETDKRVALMAEMGGVPADKLREELRSSGRIEELRYSIRESKVRAFLREKAEIRDGDGKPAPDAAVPLAPGAAVPLEPGAAEPSEPTPIG